LSGGRGTGAPGRRTLFQAFRDNEDWRRLYAARTVSLFGDWFNALAIVHLLGRGRYDSALPLAVVFALKQLPVFLFGPLAGVVADRFNRKKILISCDLLASVIVLFFLLAGHAGSDSWLYVLTAAQITIAAFAEPARQALTPSLVRREDLLSANTLSSATWSTMFTLGSAAGSLVLAAVGWEAAILLDACTYVVSAWILTGLPIRATDAPARPPRDSGEGAGALSRLLGLEDVKEGLRYIAGDRRVFRLILVKFGWGSMGAITLFLTLLGASEGFRLGGSADLGIGFLWTCRGIGTGLGPFLARGWAGGDPRRLEHSLTLAFFGAPLVYMGVALSGTWWLAGFLVFLAHLGGSTLWVISTVLLQMTVPPEVRGRTFAAELGLVMLSSTGSHLVYASLLDFGGLGLTATMLCASTLCLIPAVLWLWSGRKLAASCVS